jgi:C1A family cysteine protease
MSPSPERQIAPRTGFMPPPMDLSHLTGQTGIQGRSAYALPPQYDWRDQGVVTPVRDQGNCGSCYTFGYLGSVEARLLIDNAGTFDLSENNAKECNWQERSNFEYPAGNRWGSCDGGNAYMLTSLASQAGTVLESCDPYRDSDVACESGCAYKHTVLDWRIISGRAVPSSGALKQYLYDHGPIITSMYAQRSEFYGYDGSYTLNYTAPGDSTDNCVLLVGWSDSLPPEPGSTSPASGWIVKNSWGTGWGDRGFFYIAYGAANIGMWSSFPHEYQAYDAQGDIWFYDDGGWWSSYGYSDTTAWGLAKFFAGDDTNVTRVEFWTTDRTTDVDVYLYDDFDGTEPSNLLASKPDNAYGEAGYHSVLLDTPVPVARDDDVIAVVKFTNASFGYPVPTDPHGPTETGRTYLSHNGALWTDMGAAQGTDVAIRLRTSTGSTAPVVTSITPNRGSNDGVVIITNLAGSGFQPGATARLTRAGQPDVGATNINVLSGSKITCQLDLTGTALGPWDVVVTNPDDQSGSLPAGFTVYPATVQESTAYLPLVLARAQR